MLNRFIFVQPLILTKIFIVAVISRLSYFIAPITFALMIDYVIPSNCTSMFIIALLLFFLATILSNFGNYYMQYLHSYYLNIVRKNASIFLLGKYLRTDKESCSGIEYGSLLSLLTSDVGLYFSFLSMEMFFAPFDLMLAGISFIILLNYNHALIYLALIIGMLSSVLSYFLTRSIKHRSEQTQRAKGTLRQYLNSLIRGIHSIKTTNTYDYMLEKFKEYSSIELVRASFCKLQSANPMFVNQVSGRITGVLIVLIIGQQILKGDASIGDLVMLLVVGKYIQSPFVHYRIIRRALRQSAGSHSRIRSIIEMQDEVTGKHRIEEDASIPVIYQNVWFSYGDEAQSVLKGVNLSAGQGESVGIVGKSGAGKTTIINLLLGFYRPTKGRILIGDTDIKDCDIDSLRRHIGIVPQNPYIFNRSIRENILLGRDIDSRDFSEVLDISGVSQIIGKMPHGINSRIGEDGSKLSGGQIKRVAIARALVDKPSVLVLDEATSELDSASEESIKNSIEYLIHKCTLIVIAHRLSTVANLDRIYLLDKGKIACAGTHSQLVSTSDLYKELFTGQLKG